MTRRKFSPEFREQAVRLVLESSRPIADVARELGVGTETLRVWVNRYKKSSPVDEPGLSEPERAELERLRKENRELRMEKEFLGKAAAFFAKEFR
ncbi:transposase [Tessaracoccus sp. ZS01]|uniref:transposase n=1 Tax=Tessaracoccus sp. ZS01 TaxID=1906324 RepID=UPI00096F8379|nr:transposase [Tessaracoccus sp. ZS01]MCG6567919.1 hypothetical protein [Tessaracoccus sp. ZS01]OMG54384.1 hypothetical protein BJN44_09865 [Tessaracoccus sp. ZS01]